MALENRNVQVSILQIQGYRPVPLPNAVCHCADCGDLERLLVDVFVKGLRMNTGLKDPFLFFTKNNLA